VLWRDRVNYLDGIVTRHSKAGCFLTDYQLPAQSLPSRLQSTASPYPNISYCYCSIHEQLFGMTMSSSVSRQNSSSGRSSGSCRLAPNSLTPNCYPKTVVKAVCAPHIVSGRTVQKAQPSTVILWCWLYSRCLLMSVSLIPQFLLLANMLHLVRRYILIFGRSVLIIYGFFAIFSFEFFVNIFL
jgi:hypothetical protein